MKNLRARRRRRRPRLTSTVTKCVDLVWCWDELDRYWSHRGRGHTETQDSSSQPDLHARRYQGIPTQIPMAPQDSLLASRHAVPPRQNLPRTLNNLQSSSTQTLHHIPTTVHPSRPPSQRNHPVARGHRRAVHLIRLLRETGSRIQTIDLSSHKDSISFGSHKTYHLRTLKEIISYPRQNYLMTH